MSVIIEKSINESYTVKRGTEEDSQCGWFSEFEGHGLYRPVGSNSNLFDNEMQTILNFMRTLWPTKIGEKPFEFDKNSAIEEGKNLNSIGWSYKLLLALVAVGSVKRFAAGPDGRLWEVEFYDGQVPIEIPESLLKDLRKGEQKCP